MRYMVSVFILSVLIGAALHAQITRYVSVTGDDLAGGNTCGDESAPCRTIGQAISVSSGGDVVIIAAGAYTESIAIDKPLSLQGAGREITIIQAHATAGSASNRVIEITDASGVEVSGLTIRHGVMDGGPFVGMGGGIASQNSSLVLEEVAVTDNSAESQGGGIFADGGTIVLNDVIILGNTAIQGGGLWTRDNSPEFTDVLFEDNATTGSGGGGMYATSASPTLTNVVFAQNKTPILLGGGGGMRNAGSTAQLVNVQFIGNESQLGGGMYNTGESVITLTDVLFSENKAGSTGGGLSTWNSSAVMNGVVFENNESENWGGGMNALSSTVVMSDVVIEGNTAVNGGGINSNNSSFTMNQVTLTGNSADWVGGMRNVDDTSSVSVLMHVIFDGNFTTGGPAGGMYNENSSPILINTVFSGNSAGAGGAMYNIDNSSPVLTNVSISGNSVEGDGGGLLNVITSSPVLTNVIVWNNLAAGNTASGSASIYNGESSSAPVISFSLIEHSGGSGGNWDTAIGEDGGGNIDANPLFMNGPDPALAPSTGGDLRLMAGSPAIDAGDPDMDLSVFYTNDGEIPIDTDGNPRVDNGRIDIGAYEFQSTVTGIDRFDGLPSHVVLYQNYPNPFNPSTVIAYSLPKQMMVELAVYDVLGRLITTAVNDVQSAGVYEVRFDAASLPSGVYVYRLRAHAPTDGSTSTVQTGRMLLMR